MKSPIPKPSSDELRAEFKKLWSQTLKKTFIDLAGQNPSAAEHVAWAAFRAGRREGSSENKPA